MPAWHLIKDTINNYVMDGSIDILTSRGCPHKCRFCYNESYHKSIWRGRTQEDVLLEVDWVTSNIKIPIKKINFIDDNFFTNRKRALDICRRVGKKQLKMHVDIRCDYVSKKLIDEIYSYGVNDFYFGIESGSQKVLNLMYKGISVRNIRDTIEIMKQYDIKSVFSFLIGYPGEEPADLQETLSIAGEIYRNIRGASILMNIFTIYPGTYFYNQFRKNLKSYDADSYNWETARNKFWINNKAYLESIYALFRFLNLPPDTTHSGTIKKVINNIFHTIAKFRVRHGFFKFLFEFRAANHFIQYRSQ
jgi:anaerobic magnesium-protoporphyrin IX monomethyl ester cyclase